MKINERKVEQKERGKDLKRKNNKKRMKGEILWPPFSTLQTKSKEEPQTHSPFLSFPRMLFFPSIFVISVLFIFFFDCFSPSYRFTDFTFLSLPFSFNFLQPFLTLFPFIFPLHFPSPFFLFPFTLFFPFHSPYFTAIQFLYFIPFLFFINFPSSFISFPFPFSFNLP